MASAFGPIDGLCRLLQVTTLYFPLFSFLRITVIWYLSDNRFEIRPKSLTQFT